MRTKTLHVSLDTTAMPPVTVAEEAQPVGRHRRRDRLTWSRAISVSAMYAAQSSELRARTILKGLPPWQDRTSRRRQWPGQ